MGETIKTVLPSCWSQRRQNLRQIKQYAWFLQFRRSRLSWGQWCIPFYCDSGDLCTLNCVSILSFSEGVEDKRKDTGNKHKVWNWPTQQQVFSLVPRHSCWQRFVLTHTALVTDDTFLYYQKVLRERNTLMCPQSLSSRWYEAVWCTIMDFFLSSVPVLRWLKDPGFETCGCLGQCIWTFRYCSVYEYSLERGSPALPMS